MKPGAIVTDIATVDRGRRASVAGPGSRALEVVSTSIDTMPDSPIEPPVVGSGFPAKFEANLERGVDYSVNRPASWTHGVFGEENAMRPFEIGAAVVLATTGMAHMAEAIPVDELIVLGDSNVDIGRAASPLVRDGLPGLPPLNTVGGRSSDGTIIPEFIAERVGVSQLNFAWGGARSDRVNIIGGEATFTGLERQVDEFVDLLAGSPANPGALYLLWAGSNNLFGDIVSGGFELLDKASETDVMAAVSGVVDDLADAVTRLTDLGARNIVVANRATRPVLSDSTTPWTLPDLDPALDGVQNPELNDAAGNALNDAIDALIPGLDAGLSSDVFLFDADAYIRDIIAASGTNGFLRYSDDPAAYCVAQADGDCSDLINYDGAHKTSAVHSILADDFIAEFDLTAAPAPIPLPAAGWLMLAPLGGLMAMRRRRHR